MDALHGILAAAVVALAVELVRGKVAAGRLRAERDRAAELAAERDRAAELAAERWRGLLAARGIAPKAHTEVVNE
jgi:hypothetical protein